MVTKER